MGASFCGQCGRAADVGSHVDCTRALLLEPPRFCTSCARRMKVQVTPVDWSATCVEHGATSG
jgi:hypothetical protein